jgi:hypothetical protein
MARLWQFLATDGANSVNLYPCGLLVTRKKLIHAVLATFLMSTAGVATAIEPAEDPTFDFHRLAKHYMYGTLTEQYAQGVSDGTEQPLLKFRVLDEPSSLFINFQIDPDKVDDLVAYLNLPAGFELTPIAILKGDAPRLYLTLNIYAVDGLQGLLSGLRGEWSVYVRKDGGRASYMVVDARATKLTLDSVDWFRRGTLIVHPRTDAGLRSFVASDKGTFFYSLVKREGIDNAKRFYPKPSWVSANDRIYWRNRVADRTYYDGDAIDSPVLSVDPAVISLRRGRRQWRPIDHQRPPGRGSLPLDIERRTETNPSHARLPDQPLECRGAVPRRSPEHPDRPDQPSDHRARAGPKPAFRFPVANISLHWRPEPGELVSAGRSLAGNALPGA